MNAIVLWSVTTLYTEHHIQMWCVFGMAASLTKTTPFSITLHLAIVGHTELFFEFRQKILFLKFYYFGHQHLHIDRFYSIKTVILQLLWNFEVDVAYVRLSFYTVLSMGFFASSNKSFNFLHFSYHSDSLNGWNIWRTSSASGSIATDETLCRRRGPCVSDCSPWINFFFQPNLVISFSTKGTCK